MTYTVILAFDGGDTMFMEHYETDTAQDAAEKCVADVMQGGGVGREITDIIVIEGGHDDHFVRVQQAIDAGQAEAWEKLKDTSIQGTV